MGLSGAGLGHFGQALEPPNCVLDASWERLEGFWRRLEAIWVSLGSNLDAQEAPKAGPELNSRGFRSVFARFLGVFPRSKAKSDNS